MAKVTERDPVRGKLEWDENLLDRPSFGNNKGRSRGCFLSYLYLAKPSRVRGRLPSHSTRLGWVGGGGSLAIQLSRVGGEGDSPSRYSAEPSGKRGRLPSLYSDGSSRRRRWLPLFLLAELSRGRGRLPSLYSAGMRKRKGRLPLSLLGWAEKEEGETTFSLLR